MRMERGVPPPPRAEGRTGMGRRTRSTGALVVASAAAAVMVVVVVFANRRRMVIIAMMASIPRMPIVRQVAVWGGVRRRLRS